MILTYTFEGIMADVCLGGDHYRRQSIDVENYEYEVCVSLEDVIAFLKPPHWVWDKMSSEEQSSFIKGIKAFFDSELFKWVLYDDEFDDTDYPDFYEFMKERYESKAREKCEDDYY